MAAPTDVKSSFLQNASGTAQYRFLQGARLEMRLSYGEDDNDGTVNPSARRCQKPARGRFDQMPAALTRISLTRDRPLGSGGLARRRVNLLRCSFRCKAILQARR